MKKSAFGLRGYSAFLFLLLFIPFSGCLQKDSTGNSPRQKIIHTEKKKGLTRRSHPHNDTAIPEKKEHQASTGAGEGPTEEDETMNGTMHREVNPSMDEEEIIDSTEFARVLESVEVEVDSSGFQP